MKQLSKLDRYVIKKVRERRLALKMSQSALTSSLGYSSGFVGQVESDKYPTHYNLRHLNELAKILKCNITDLVPEKPL
jgi:transcriptional regulator with XRE-family HTH domain